MRAAHLPVDEQLERFQAALHENLTLIEVLNRAKDMNLPGWYLVAGCLYQTVWNVVTGQPAEVGILDYDLAYFDDSDLSWEAEDTVIRAGNQVFAGLTAPVQIRNQARVHLWYEQKFGKPCPPYDSTEAAIDTFEATAACLGVRLEPGGRWRVYAPFGLSDVFNLIVRPNPVLAPRDVYQRKTTRWKQQWPGLTVLPWPAPGLRSRQAAKQRESEQRPDPRQVHLAGRHLHHHDQPGLVDQPQLEHLQLDQSRRWMPDPDHRWPEVAHGMFGPPLPELRACLTQRLHELGEPRVPGTPPGRDPELTQHGPGRRFPPHHAGAVDRVGEHHPQHVAPIGGH